MLNELRRIHIEPNSELDHFLDGVGVTPVLLEKDGKLYRLEEERGEDLWAGYDPEKAAAALNEVAGSWADIDTDMLIADIYRAREAGSRPTNRP
jgi:hypothetical protein